MKEKIIQMSPTQYEKRQKAFIDFGWNIDSPTHRSMGADDFFKATTDHSFTTKLYGGDRWWLLGKDAR